MLSNSGSLETAGAHAQFRLFVESTVYCEAGERPGLVAMTTPTGPVIPVFTSETELARFRGAVRWFSTTGADLLDLVPPGYDLVLDPAGPHPTRLRPQATRRVARIEYAGADR